MINTDRIPPHCQDSERGVITEMLSTPESRIKLLPLLSEASFYVPAHRILYNAIASMDARGKEIDFTTLLARLRADGNVDKIGGVAELSELFAPLILHRLLDEYLATVLEKQKHRLAIAAHESALQALYTHNPLSPLSETLATCQTALTTQMEGHQGESSRDVTVINAGLDHADYLLAIKTGELKLIPTGIPSFDKRAKGLGGDEYWLVAGPTKGGKTVLAAGIFKHAAIHGFKACYYTAEIGATTLAGRLIYSVGKVGAEIDRTGMQTREEEMNYANSLRYLQDALAANTMIVKAQGMSIEAMLADMRAKAKLGYTLFVIDYLAKLWSSQKHQSREREMAYMSMKLFELTKLCNVTALVLSQLNDDGQIRECRGLEHDCDGYLRIARVVTKPARGDNEAEYDDKRRHLIVERGRSVEAGYTIPMHFDGRHFRMIEMDMRQQTSR